MPRPGQAPPETWKPNTADAKRKFLEYIAAGDTNAAAALKVGRTTKGVEYWRREDVEFRSQMDFVRARRQGNLDKAVVPDFPEFCEEYLGFKLHWHQLQWFDIIEGREPRELHPSQIYEIGRHNRILINTPPNHAKSTTITQAYVTWRICKNPNDHVVIVSKTMKRSKEFLYAIKKYLSHPTYRKLQQAFGPVETWQKTAAAWTTSEITLVSEETDGEKDPTVQALGIGGQIYGVRASLIVLDDVVDLGNAGQFEQQITWLSQEVLNRPGQMTGMIICVGTRVAATDFYSELRVKFPGVYTYFASPAVLQYADEVADWRVLWPDREDGNTSAEALNFTRGETSPSSWARAYQQQSISDDAIFPSDLLMLCVNKMRGRGPLADDDRIGRPGGMQDLVVIAGMDLATVGFTAAIVIGVDRKTKMRYVLDLFNNEGTSPAKTRAMIHDFTERYNISEWRIEKNGFQQFLTQDEPLRLYLNNRGCILREHHTGANKWDADFGIQSMETLFVDAADGNALIEFPNPARGGATGTLIEQLVAWAPKTKGKTDLVMALWIAELKAREITRDGTDGPKHFTSSFMTRRNRSEQMVVDLEALAQTSWAASQTA